MQMYQIEKVLKGWNKSFDMTLDDIIFTYDFDGNTVREVIIFHRVPLTRELKLMNRAVRVNTFIDEIRQINIIENAFKDVEEMYIKLKEIE